MRRLDRAVSNTSVGIDMKISVHLNHRPKRKRKPQSDTYVEAGSAGFDRHDPPQAITIIKDFSLRYHHNKERKITDSASRDVLSKVNNKMACTEYV